MAKLKNPLLSFSARGALTKSLTFVRRGHLNLVKVTPDPPDARSLAQLSWRHMYQKAVALWHSLSPAEKLTWQSQASIRHMTGFAWFMSQALKPNPGLYLPLQGGTMAGDIHMDGNLIDGLPDPSADTEAARKKYVDDEIAAINQVQGCRVYNNASLPIQHNTWTNITFNSERWDTDAIHDPAVNPERLTCKTAGKYLVHGQIVWQANGTGIRTLALLKGGAWRANKHKDNLGATISVGMDISTILDMAVGQYARLVVRQQSGFALNANYSEGICPELMMHRIG